MARQHQYQSRDKKSKFFLFAKLLIGYSLVLRLPNREATLKSFGYLIKVVLQSK